MVVAVLAVRRRRWGFAGWDKLDQRAVALITLDDHFRRQFELRVGQHPLEFVERSLVGEAFDPAGLQRGHDRHGIEVGPMEEIEDDVGIED